MTLGLEAADASGCIRQHHSAGQQRQRENLEGVENVISITTHHLSTALMLEFRNDTSIFWFWTLP